MQIRSFDTEMGGRYRPQNPQQQSDHSFQSPRISLTPGTLLVIKLPDPRFLLVLSRSLFLAMVIITLPFIWSVLKGPSGSVFNAVDFHQNSGSISFEYWNLILQDFANEGLIKKGHKALVLNSAIEGVADGGSMFVNNDEIDVMVEPDLERQSSLPDEGFDFVFVSDSLDSKFVDRVVKIGGVIAMQLGDDISSSYQKQSDYRIVYLKKYSSTIVAMKKLGSNNHLLDSSAKRRLCQLTLEAKKAALKGLEDVLFGPPRRALAKSHAYLKKFNFLPDLLGDSLEHYPCRVFIDVGSPEDKNVMKWFDKNYPKRNQEFEVYNLEMGFSGGEARRVTLRIDVSDWLMKNAREEEYVVMKADAEVVEQMIKRRAIGLVDELFLDCNNQWQGGGKKNKKKKKSKSKSKRAYWECLALYGRLRDEGVAVHQWWE